MSELNAETIKNNSGNNNTTMIDGQQTLTGMYNTSSTDSHTTTSTINKDGSKQSPRRIAISPHAGLPVLEYQDINEESLQIVNIRP
jgi:hypothetical protein